MKHHVRRTIAIAAAVILTAAGFTTVSSQPASAVESFVQRSGSQLTLDGAPFRFSGPNIYWLGLFRIQGSSPPSYPTAFQVIDALDTAQEMGATVVRAHTLGISVGCTLCISPTLGTYNEEAFKKADFAIKAAADRGLRLIIPLTDEWAYYHGGKKTFTDWRGVAESGFYTNTTVVNDYTNYISALLNRVNSITGVAYKNDPTILAWETGNELNGATATWTQGIAQHIKSIDANHLVIDGSYGVKSAHLSIPEVDIYTNHYYSGTMDATEVAADAALTAAAGKAFFAGEYPWARDTGGASLTNFLAEIESNTNIAGDSYWSLMSHGNERGFIDGGDGLSLMYPGATTDPQTRSTQLRNHAFVMRGTAAPATSTDGRPLVTSIRNIGSAVLLSWRGVAGAATYTIERSTAGSGGPWTVVCNQCVTDVAASWTVTGPAAGWYRVTPISRSGTAGTVSEPVQYDALYDVRVVDEISARTTGAWTRSSFAPGDFQNSYLVTGTGDGSRKVTWSLGSDPGHYDVYIWLPDGYPDRASNATFTVRDADGTKTVTHNMQTAGGQWKPLTTARISGTAAELEVSNAGNNSYVVAGAVKLVNKDAPIVVDNAQATVVGAWTSSTNMPDYLGSDYLIKTMGTGTAKVTWTPTIGTSGNYTVSYWLPDGYPNRATDAAFRVRDGNGVTTSYPVDQRPAGGAWVVLGTHYLAAGTSAYVELTDSATGTYIVADAIRFVPS
jgi:hypothetical protein